MTTLRRVLQQSEKLNEDVAKPATATTTEPLEPAALKTQNITWVQCNTCEKWRKLPPGVEEQLPDVWTCNMNKWAVNGSCSDPEDTEDVVAVDVVDPKATAAATAAAAAAAVVVEKPAQAPPPPTTATATTTRERRAPQPAPIPLAPLLPPGINLYGQAFQVPPAGKNARIVTYRDLIASHYRNNKTFNPHYDHICDVRYAAFSAYTSPTVHLQPHYHYSQPPKHFESVATTTATTTVSSSALPPKKRHKAISNAASEDKTHVNEG